MSDVCAASHNSSSASPPMTEDAFDAQETAVPFASFDVVGSPLTFEAVNDRRKARPCASPVFANAPLLVLSAVPFAVAPGAGAASPNKAVSF